MTHEEARALAQFIKDHDKRFEATARTEGPGGSVLLIRTSDGTALEPVVSTAQYKAEQIDQNDPGPTVRAAWEEWHP